MNTDETPQLLNVPENKWLVRVTEKHGGDNRKGQMVRLVQSELIYGRLHTEKKKNDVTMTTIEGKAYHILTGPTAQKSLQDMADDLNAKGTVPEDKPQIKTRLDGFKQTFAQCG